jgi:hypothetical protein
MNHNIAILQICAIKQPVLNQALLLRDEAQIKIYMVIYISCCLWPVVFDNWADFPSQAVGTLVFQITTGRFLNISYWRAEENWIFEKGKNTLLRPDIVPPSLKAHESLWTEISYYKLVWFTSTVNTLLHTMVNKQWHLWRFDCSINHI